MNKCVRINSREVNFCAFRKSDVISFIFPGLLCAILRSFTSVSWGCFSPAQIWYRANHNSVDLFIFLKLCLIMRNMVFKFLSLNFSFHSSCYFYFSLFLSWLIDFSTYFCYLPFALLSLYFLLFCVAFWIILHFLFLASLLLLNLKSMYFYSTTLFCLLCVFSVS